MNFKDALSCMKQGCAVTLPEWGGYWAWDAECKTVNMHCKDGIIVDMRDSPDMDFTLSHTFRDDWKIVVNRKNTQHYKARSLQEPV